MKVKELIEILQSINPEHDVNIVDKLTLFEITDIKKVTFGVNITIEEVESRWKSNKQLKN